MPQYKVSWCIDLDDENPVNAVQATVLLLQNTKNNSVVMTFEVESPNGLKAQVEMMAVKENYFTLMPDGAT